MWALQAVHVPDMYYKLYEPEDPAMDDSGIFFPTTDEEFNQMLELYGIDSDEA